MIGIKKKSLLLGLATIAFLSITTVVGIANTFIGEYQLKLEKEHAIELQEKIDTLKDENRDLTIVNACQRDELNRLEKEVSKWKCLGTFTITHYCNCSKCQEEYVDITATGTKPRTNYTIAVDPTVIPLNSKIKIDGKTYIAEDTGGAIKENRIDVFVSSHEEAKAKGVQKHTVYIKTE